MIGATGTETELVTYDKLALCVGSGDTEVFATPALAALMEAAAVQAVVPYLEAGQTTVGTRLELSHTAPTPEGMTVAATATVTAVEGRSITFSITAADESGPVGEAIHQRVIVDRERFTARAKEKKQHEKSGR